MKKSFVTFLLMVGLAGVTAKSAFAAASITNATGGSAISADKARIGGTGSFTTLTGPVLIETDSTGMPSGSMILNAPSGFEFDTTANSVSVTVTATVAGTDALINTNSSTTGQAASKSVTPTTNSITIWVTTDSSSGARSKFTWSGIKVRPINGTPLANGTMTYSGTSSGISASSNMGTLTEVAGPGSKLAITQSPATNAAGSSLTPAVQVRVQDSVGNNVGTNNVSITVTLDHGSFDFGGTTDVTGTNGAVVFSTLQINTATNYLLSATASGFTGATPVPLTITPTAPFSIQFIQDAPSNAIISTVFSPSVVVKVADFFGNGINTQTVSMAMIGGGSLSGTTARVTGTSGLATFNDLSTSTAGTNKNLVASMTSPALSATGTTFTVGAGTPTKLGFTILPATTTAGVAIASVKVQVQDVAGNSFATNGVSIFLALNPANLASGTTNLTTGADGSATFTDLVINVAGNYTLTASAPDTSLTSTPATPFTIVPGPVSTFQFTQDAPASVTAGQIFSPNVTVQLADSFSNPISNKTVSLSLNAGGPLLGTTSRATDGSGVTTFTNLSINVAGTNYGLIASITSPSMSITGSTFVVNTDVPSKLAYTTAPVATNTAGVTMPSFVVQIQDQFNNNISTNGVPIAITLNTGNFTSGTSNMNSAADGSATFSDLLLNTAGNYTLTASAPGLTSLNRSLTILPGSITVFQFVQGAPASTAAGTVFSPPVTVQIADAFSNAISNKTVTLTLNAGGPLLGTTSRASDGTGVATYTNLSINVAGTNYALIASITSPSMSVTGSTFVVNTAAPTKLIYTTLPASTNTAGNTLPTFVVQIEDQFNNFVATNGVPIKVALNTSSFASGTTNLTTDLNGSATFTDLVINVAGTYTMSATSTGLTATARLITVLPGTFAITFQQDAPSPATAGVIFSPAVAVRIADGFNNVLSNTTVTLALLGSGILNGTTSRATATNGVATFTNLTINVVGTNYSLVATSTNSLSVTGATFAVNAAAASKLVYTSVPATTNIAGATLSSFTVQITDQFNNNIATNDVPITMSLSSGTFASGTATTNSDLNGSATFDNLVITNAGNNTLTASAAGLTSTNKSLVILPATFAITFQQDAPALATAGTVFAPPVAVKIVDAFNNVLSNTTVTLTLNGGGALNGTTSRATTNNGVATFTNLTVNVVGTNYSLTASISSPSLSVTGNTFAVNAAVASKLVFSTAPAATNTVGQTLPTFVVQIRDAFNNNISTSDVPITISLSTGTFASGTSTTNTLADGSATFSDLVITNSGNNVLTAAATGLTSTNKAITILADAANTIAFVQVPPASMTAGTVFTNTVRITDQFNNGLSNVTVTLAPNGFATLNGTLSRTTAGNGVATFTNLSVNTPGSGYSITATGASLSTTSTTFDVTVGAIHHYVVSAASNQTRGVAFPVTVTAQDVVSNTVPDNSTVVTMSSSSANVTFDVNPQTLSNGTFVVNAQDNTPETISLYAQDANGKAGTNANIVVSAATGDYRSSANGAWSNIATWQVWDGSAWVAASTAPAGGAGTNITIQSAHLVSNAAPVSLTGTLITQGILTNRSTGTITVDSGGLIRNSGTILSTVNNLIFNSGATYQHNYTTSAGNIPTSAWNTGSTCSIIGFTTATTLSSATGWNQSFYNFTYNCPGQGSTFFSMAGALTTVNGNFTVTSGNLYWVNSGNVGTTTVNVGGNFVIQGGAFTWANTASGTLTLSIAGNYNQTGGTFSNGSTDVAINFTGANRTFTRSGGTISTTTMNFLVNSAASLTMSNGLAVSSGHNFTVVNGGTLYCGTNVISGAGTFALSAGGTLGIGSANGITASTSAGNIQTTTRTFNIGGTYIYNGATAQTTSDGLPATVRSLIVSNTADIVTLSASVTVSNDLSVASGTLDLGSFTANRATSGGTNTVANGATVKIGGANTLPSNYTTRLVGATSTIEFSGTAQSVPAQTYGNLATSGSGQKSLQAGATAIAGNLAIGSGTTFNAGTNNFSLAGNLTNNGSLYAYGVLTQTITFNGASPQSVSGAASTAFNNVALNSGSVLNLTGNHTALNLTIAGVPQVAGTWGATGSGATNIDDTHFQGTGILNVTHVVFLATFIQDAPPVVTAGTIFSPPVQVQLSDSILDFVTNRTVTLSLNGGGTLNGTLSQITDTNGVATFTNLSVNTAGSYTLTATAPSLSISSTGGTFSVVSTTATKLVFTTVPPVTNAPGVTIPTFVVQLQDQFNNNVATDTVPIAISLNTGSFTSGTQNMNSAVDGSATFFDLLLNTAGSYTLTASSPGLTSAARSLVITNGPITVFQFTQDAPATTTAGTIFTPPVTVHIADAFNNPVTNKTVTLGLNGGGTLNGTLSRVTSLAGVATFTNLNVTVPGSNYSLTASITSPTMSVTGSTFVVTTAAASKLVYTSLPAATNVAGATLSTFIVQIQDAFSNNVASSGVPITMTLNTGSFSSGTTNLATDLDGSATFLDLVINTIGTYTMSATSPGLTSAARSITVVPAIASNIVFVQQPPAVTNAGATFSPSVTVKVTDQFNNAISNIAVIASLNGAGTLNGTLTRATLGTGIATFNNLSVNQPGVGYSLTAITTNPALSVTSSNFDVNVGPLDHYLVAASTPQTRGVAFPVTVTAQDAASNTVNNSFTAVTMSSGSANVTFDVNPKTLSNGTFTVTAQDNNAESITITATDPNSKIGSTNITINAATGDYRSLVTGPWNTASTWQVWDGANWVTASTPPAGGAGTNITILSTHRVTNNVAVALSGTLITQGSLTFNGGSIAVGSGGLVVNSGAITGSVSTLIFNSGGTYQHAQNGGTIPPAAYNSNSLLRVTGVTSTVPMLPTSGVNGNVEWNSPNQTAATAIFLTSATTIGGDFNIVSTGSGSIIGGGSTARNLSVGGNMNVQGGAFNALGGNGSTGSGLNLSVSVAQNLTVSGGTFSLVVSEDSGTISAALTVGGNLAVNSGNLTLVTGASSSSNSTYSMIVSGNTSVAAGILNLTDSTGGTSGGITASLRGNLSITGGTISRTGSRSTTVNFAGTSLQTYSKSAGTISGAIDFAILSGATVNFGTSLLDGSSGAFTLNSGGAIGIGDPAGITTSGAAGNIRVTGTRTYSIGGTYIYNGATAQTTSNGLPATVRSLIVSNTADTVTLSANVAISNDLRVVAGTLDLGSFTANRITSGGTNVVVDGATLKIGGTGTLPSNYTTRSYGPNSTIEYEGAAQNVSAQTYGHLVTSGSSTKTLQAGATAIAGNLTIGSSTTFGGGTNNFSLAGNWANNGSGFTGSGSQTVTFNGASPQTVSGTPMSLNNVAINSGSAMNIAFTGTTTANALSIGGTNKLAGTWGATGSGATFIDDVHFQGTTGVLNVTSGPTSTTLISNSLNPAAYGQSIIFTAQVVAVGGPPPATGTVTFMEGANTLGTGALSGSPTGLATFVTSSFGPGTYAITAVYGGDSNFAGSTSVVLSQQVNVATLIITANSTNKTYGETVTFAGTEFGTTGLVGTDSVASVTLTSAGTTSGANAGNYDILPSSAVGYDLSHYSITYSNGTLTVNQASSSVAVGSSTNPACQYAPVRFTANVTAGAGTPTGTVQFKIDTIDFGSPASLVGGVATSAVTSALAAGSHTVTAVYNGDVNFTGSTSPDFTQTVTAAPATPSVGNNGPICAGTTLNLTASTVSNATYAWTGPNSFTSSDQNPVITNATTAATGTYSVTVTVDGCTSLAGTTVATVNGIPSAPTAGNDSPTCGGGTVNLTASTVSNATYAWTGPNVFSSSDQNPVISNVTAAAVGTYNVMVTVNGCTSTAGTTIVSINIPPSISTNPASQSVSAGSPVTFTVVATGTTLNYQWRKGGVDISGETASSYNIASTVASDATNYDCVVSNICGVVTSDPATLTVITMTPFEQWQMQYFGCTNCAQAAANTDADGDGQNNLAEFLSGTVPTNSVSALHTTSVVRQGVDVLISWATAGGHTNAVQLTTGGYNTNFVDLSSPIIITGSGDTSTNYTDFGGATNAIPRFYRIRLVP